MTPRYPEVYYSKNIKELLNKKPPFRPEPIYPSRPEREGSMMGGCLLIGGGICAIIGFIFTIGGDGDYIALLIGGIAAVAISLIYTKASERIQETRFKNSSAMNQYYADHKRWEMDRSKAMTPEVLSSYRKQCYSNLSHFEFSSSVFSDRNIQEQIVQKGATESFFFSHLNDSGMFILYEPMHLDHYQHSYYPDIVISSADGKVLFDIEIDEPYAFEDRSPIHYINENGISVDSSRNEVFTSNGFCVVRFSEQQIVKRTQECIEYLQSIVNDISNGISSIPQPPDALSQKKWTATEARMMAQNAYRESYLPKNLQTEITTSRLSSYRPHTYAEKVSDDLPF